MKTVKQVIFGFIVAAMLIILSGCATTEKIFGKKASAEADAKASVVNVETLLGANLKEKLEQVANISYGVGYALGKEANPSQAVEIAKELNSRAASLTGAPTLEEMKKMKQMIDDLTSELATERERGSKALEDKDSEIYGLQLKSKLLVEAKDKEIQKYMKLSQDTALKADAMQSKLDDMNSFFGFGAIWYGLKKFVISMSWIIGIGSIIYLVLRFASMSNPLAASIFSIFDTIMSWCVNMIKVLAPKALEVAGQTATRVANGYRDAMTKMIDNIEALKEMQKRDPSKKFTIDEFLDELSKSLDTTEKAMVDKIKRDIGYTG